MHTFKAEEKNRQEVIRDLQEKLELVEQAITRLSHSRNCVESNASMVKAAVLRDISDVLTTLRNREVNLLRQIDLMEARHLNILHTQYAEVHQILGNLKHVMYCVERQEDSHAHTFSDSDVELVATVLKQKVSSSPITYSRDINELNTTIQHFGAVATNLSALQVTKELVSKCLPSKLEEYEDGDQQLLYKTLEEIKEKKESGSMDCSKFPKLSNNKEDWLRKYNMPTVQASPAKAEFCFPDCFRQTDCSFWLRQTAVGAKLSPPLHYPKEQKVEEWWCQIRQKDAVQNEFHGQKTEQVEGKARDDHCSSVASESIEMISHPETLASDEFCHVQSMEYISSFADSDFFKLLTEPLQSYYRNSKPLHNCCQAENMNVGIETLHTIPCTVPGDGPCSDDTNKWLIKPDLCKRAALERSFSNMLQLGCICCANEPCGSLSDCVCKEECVHRTLEMKGTVNKNAASRTEEPTWLRVAPGANEECKKWLNALDAGQDEKVDLSEKMHGDLASDQSKSSPVCSSNDLSSWLSPSSVEIGEAECHARCIRADMRGYFLQINKNVWLTTDQPCLYDSFVHV